MDNVSINQMSIAELRLTMITQYNVSLILDAAADQFANKASRDSNGQVLEHFYKYIYFSFLTGYQGAQEVQKKVEEHETK
jgi:hypothetical protein